MTQIGKIVKVITPKKGERPAPTKTPERISVPNWPVKQPVKVPQKVQ